MKTLLFAAAIFLFVNFSFCQTSLTGSVSGEGRPLAYAAVMLKKTVDSSLFKGEITNEKGSFVFSGVPAGNYYLQIQNLGFRPYFKTGISVDDKSASIDLGILSLTPADRELKEVTIRGEKPFIERQADKTVVNIENSIVQAGSSIMEVMEKLPGVIVDRDGNIRLRGKQGVVIMIDGKPSALSGQDLANLLRGMSSENIQRIEIITNPSAKWDAAGNAGIINIVSRKSRFDGYNGTISLGYGQGRYGKYQGSSGFSYKKKWFSLYASYGYAHRLGFNNLLIDRRFYENGQVKTTFVTNNYITFPSWSNHPRLGIDFNLSKKTTLSFISSAVVSQFGDNTENHTDIFGPDNQKTGVYHFTQNSKNPFHNLELDARLAHQIDTLGQEVSLTLDYGIYRNFSNMLFKTDFLDVTDNLNTTTYLLGHEIGALSLYSAKVDYSKPFKKGLSLDCGLKSSLVGSDKNMEFFDRTGDVDVFNQARSSHFLYNESISAAYASLNKKIGKLTLQSGLRAEQTLANGEQKITGQTFKRNYMQLFPTVYIDYKLNDKHGFNINLGRRIDRPPYDNLDPYKSLIDATTYNEGNPYLKPQLTWNAELNYSFKNEFMATASYSRTVDNITDVLIQDAATKTTTQTIVNLDVFNYYGLNISYSKRLTERWKTNTGLQSYLGRYRGTIHSFSINQGTPSFNLTCSNSFSLGKTLSGECNLQYNYKNLYGVTLMKTTYNLSAGLQKYMLKKKASLTLNVTDIFWKAYPSGITNFGNVIEVWKSKRDTRVINVSFTYRFGQGKTGTMRRNTGADEEKSRIGNS